MEITRKGLSSYQTIPISRILFFLLFFCYLILASGEQLYVLIGIFKPKAGHLVGLILWGWLILERKPWILPHSIFKAFGLILGSLFISAVLGAAPSRSLGYMNVYLFNFAVYFFLPFQILQRINVDSFLRTYWSSFLMVGLYAAAQVVLSLFGIYDPFATQRIGLLARGQAWTYEPSYFALYMVPYVMSQNGLALLREEQGNALTRRLKTYGQNLLLILSTSTGLIVSYPIFFGIYFFSTFIKWLGPLPVLIRKKFKKALLTFFVSLVGATILFYEIALHTIFKFFYFGFQNHPSFMARWEGIVASVETFLKHPLLGVGLGGVGPYLFNEQSTYDFKIETLEEFEAYDPTNNLTEILASLGLIGLMAFIYLGVIFYRAYQQVMVHSHIDLPSKKMATALFFSLLIMIVALQMNQGLFRPYVWIHAAVVYGYLFRLQESKLSS